MHLKTSSNHKIVTDRGIWLEKGTRQPLGKIGKVDLSKLPQAENDILDYYDWHDSLLRSERHAPDQKALEKKRKTLARALETAIGAIKAFSQVDGWIDRHEFRAAVNDLLRDAELQPIDSRSLIEEAPLHLDSLATGATVLQSVLMHKSKLRS